MTTQTSSDVQQLNDTVARLAEALATSERRYASLASMIRWGAMGLLVLVLAAAYVSSTVMAKAVAAAQDNWWEAMQEAIANDPPVLDGLLRGLGETEKIDGMIVKLLQNVSSIASLEAKKQKCWSTFRNAQGKVLEDLEGKPLEICFSEAAVRDLGFYFKNQNGEIPTPPSKDDPKYRKPDGTFDKEKYEKDMVAYQKRLMQGTLMAGAQSMVDAAVLMHRLRRDSDYFRTKIFQTGRVDKALDIIGFELEVMNRAMRLIPTMAAEMNVMNRNMSLMSYSMGSTAGRMGSMMPW